MLYEIVHEFPNDFILEEKEPSISIYQPTHRQTPDNKQDTIMFKNLIRKVEKSLEKKYKKDFIESFMKPLYELKRDRIFWDNTLDGMALFANENKCIIYKLQSETKEFTVVDDAFHIKPLIRYFQTLGRYHVLGLSRKDFVLYQGNEDEFNKVKIDDNVPKTIEEVLGEELTESHLNFSPHGRNGEPGFHGHENISEENEKDAIRYFRYVDKFIYDNYSKKQKIPLILVSLDKNQGMFKKISHNNYLLDKCIDKSYESLDEMQIKTKAQKIITAHYKEEIKQLIDTFRTLEAKEQATADLESIVKAISEKRVDKLFIEEGKVVPGKFDIDKSKIIPGDLDDPECGDVLDDLAEEAIKSKAEVLVLDKEMIPGTSGVAAILRY